MILNLSNNNSHILKDIILQLDLFTLSIYLSTDNRLLTTYILSSAV